LRALPEEGAPMQGKKPTSMGLLLVRPSDHRCRALPYSLGLYPTLYMGKIIQEIF